MEMRAVLFDLDGTLIDSLPGIEHSVDCSLAQCKQPPRTQPLRPLIGPPIRVILSALAPEANEQQLSELERAFRTSYDSDGWRMAALREGAVETLGKLKAAGLPLFLITNKPVEPTRRVLERFELTHLFTEVLCRDSQIPGFQSKAEMLDRIFSRHNLDRTACLYVGDTAEDYRAGKEAGVPVAIVAEGYGDLNTDWADFASTKLQSLQELTTFAELMEMSA